MEAVLTLIAPANAASLEESTAVIVRAVLDALGAETARPDWLAPAVACDIGFDGLDPDQAAAAARRVLGTRPVDIIAQAAAHRRKRLLVADMESTIIRQEMLDELADALGLREPVAAITARAMNGEIEFKTALRDRVSLLRGLSVDALERALAAVTPMPGATALVRTMRAHDAYCVLVSGGFTYFTTRVGTELGFDEDHGNTLEIVEGRLTGRALDPVRDKDDKLATLRSVAAARGIPLIDTLAVGDGANDIPMLRAAGLGVAFHAKPAVRAAARWRLDHADLTGLLYAQGYRAAEIVAA